MAIRGKITHKQLAKRTIPKPFHLSLRCFLSLGEGRKGKRGENEMVSERREGRDGEGEGKNLAELK